MLDAAAVVGPRTHRTFSDNPILLARSRVPAWVAVCFAIALVAARIQAGGGGAFPAEAGTPLGPGWWFGALLVVLSAVPRRIEVGAEGLKIGWLLGPRIVRYDEIVRAAPVGECDLVLELSHGETLRIHQAIQSDTPRAVLASLWQTLAAGAEGAARAHERAMLARHARSTADWAEGLASLLASGTEYRSSLTHERLWEIAANPAIDGELRGAAVVALAQTLDAPARTKLRSLARRCVMPSLKRAFSRAAEATTPTEFHAVLELAEAAG